MSELQLHDAVQTRGRVSEEIDAEIERRSERAKRLAKRFNSLPKGMSFVEFLLHPEIDALELDFVTASEMYDAYQNKVKA